VHGLEEEGATESGAGSPSNHEPEKENDLDGLWLAGLMCEECSVAFADDKEACLNEAENLTDFMLAAVELEKREIHFGVDSGAAITVIRQQEADDYPREKGSNIRMRNCQGTKVEDYGEVVLGLKTNETAPLRFAKVRAANVAKNLMAVASLLDTGHRVVFDEESYVEHKKTQKRTPIKRIGDTFDMKFVLEDFANLPAPPTRGTFRP